MEDSGADMRRLVDMAGDWIETDPSLRSTACIEAALDHAKELDAEVVALRQRVEELERENRQQYEQLRAGCTCGSGGHPNRCEKHPRAYQRHIDELDYQHSLEERAEAAEAKLARCVEALEALMEREELDLKHTYTTCDFGDSTNADRGCIWCVARAALAAAKGGE